MLAASYTYTSSGTAERQEHLRAGKFFTCRCARCLDPSELGTHFSSIRCRRCNQPDAMIDSTDPLGMYGMMMISPHHKQITYTYNTLIISFDISVGESVFRFHPPDFLKGGALLSF